jgi:hypothetical protein
MSSAALSAVAEIQSKSRQQVIQHAIERLESGIGPERVWLELGRPQLVPEDRWVWESRCSCVLVRRDGFTLGCPRQLYEAAREQERHWVAVICYANTEHRVVVKFA